MPARSLSFIAHDLYTETDPVIASKTVKKLRIWLLVLLAILLPIQGAVAAGMLCEEPGVLTPTASHGHHLSQGNASSHDDGRPIQDLSHDGTFASHGTSLGGADSFNPCVVYCGAAAALVSQVPTVPAPLDLASPLIPVFAAVAPSFVPDGLERPPRTI